MKYKFLSVKNFKSNIQFEDSNTVLIKVFLDLLLGGLQDL